MKKLIGCILILAVAASSLSLFAEEPQIAFRIFDDYVQEKQERAQRDKIGGGIAGIVTGAVLLGGGAAVWFFGDQAYPAMFDGAALNPGLKIGLTAGLGIGGGLSMIGGIDRLAKPTKDLRLQYASVYQEEDPAVQEALAAATLMGMSNKARTQRVVSAITRLSVATLTVAITIGANIASSGSYSWNSNISDALLSQVWMISGAIGSIFSKSQDELLYDKYLNTKDIFYSSGKSKKDKE